MEISTGHCWRVLEQMKERTFTIFISSQEMGSDRLHFSCWSLSNHFKQRSSMITLANGTHYKSAPMSRRCRSSRSSRIRVNCLDPVRCYAYLKQQINQIHFSFMRGKFLLPKHNNFLQKHACLNLAKEKQEQRLSACFYLFTFEFE